MRHLRIRCLAVTAVLGGGLALAVPAVPAAATADTTTFTFTGDVQEYVVPAGVCQVVVTAIGGHGAEASTLFVDGGAGGAGGTASTTLEVTAGETLEVRVAGDSTGPTGGWNGGGNGFGDEFWGASGGGGGASDVRPAGAGIDERLLVAGGGGGGGQHVNPNGLYSGGAGGGVNGSSGEGANGGGGGGSSSGGIHGGTGGDGVEGVGGNGAGFVNEAQATGGGGGGGGGGLFGGGGGGYHGGGGGGSGYGPLGTVFGTSSGPPSVSIAADPAAPGCPRLRADYRMLNSRRSSVGTASPFANSGAGANAFARERVAAPLRPVLRFPAGNGLDVSTATIHRDRYTIAVLLRLDQVDLFRRVLTFDAARDQGLYVEEGRLTFFGVGGSPGATIDSDEWVQVVLTRTQRGRLRGYVDGVEQFDLQDGRDSVGAGVVSEPEVLRLFRDNGDGEESSGAIGRLRLWDGPLSAAQVAGLGELPPAVKLVSSRASAAQGRVVQLTGQNFGPGERVRITLRDRRGRTVQLGSPLANVAGRVFRSATVPASVADGTATLRAEGLTSHLVATRGLRVL